MLNLRNENVGRNKDIVRVVLAGILEESTCKHLLDCAENHIRGGCTKLILDCGQISFISSMGLGTLVRINTRMKKTGGDVKLAAVQGPVAEVLRVSGLHLIFETYPTSDDAIAAFGG